MQITSGRIPSALKVVVYGPEGIGKSTFASMFPDPIFCDTEGSTKHMDVRRTPKPTSWAAILEQVKYFIQHPDLLKSFVLDTADWAEILCTDALCAKSQKAGIEDFGYGKGYVYLGEEFGRLLNLLEELIGKSVNVVVTAHAKMRKFEQPDEMGAYDRWEMKLSKTCAPLLKEWADMVLFASYKTLVVNVDGQGTAKGKNKAQGGQRILRTSHHPCWDAKNRFGLPEELPFEFGSIAHLFSSTPAQAPRQPAAPPRQEPKQEPAPEQPTTPDALAAPDGGIPKALRDLMDANKVKDVEIMYAVGQKGYFPGDMKISDYPEDFVMGCLVGGWPQVFDMVLKNRDEMPF